MKTVKNSKRNLLIVLFLYFAALICISFILFSCNSERQAQRHWNKGLDKNEPLFIKNSQRLAKVHYRDFATFCAEYYPPLIKDDSTQYLQARRAYDSLMTKYRQGMSEADHKIKELDAVIISARQNRNDSILIQALTDRANVLQNQLKDCNDHELVILPPIIREVSDSATREAYRQAKVAVEKMEAAKDFYKDQAAVLEAEKKGKVLVSVWWLIVAGILFVGYVVLRIRGIFTLK